MSEQHTPGPWHLSHNGWHHVVRGRGSQYIADFGMSDTAPNELEANARRIVAAVNAVEGIPMAELEGGIHGNAVQQARSALRAARDTLESLILDELTDAQEDMAIVALESYIKPALAALGGGDTDA